MQISFAVTAKLISAFVFAIQTVQSLCFLNSNFQASSHLLCLYIPVCVGPGWKPRRPVFSQRGSFIAESPAQMSGFANLRNNHSHIRQNVSHHMQGEIAVALLNSDKSYLYGLMLKPFCQSNICLQTYFYISNL